MYVTILIELITAIIGTFFYKKYKETKLKYFIFYLWYSAINEIVVGIYLKRFMKIEWGNLLYNIYYIISFVYLFILYKNYLNGKKNKNATVIFITSYIILLVINGFYQNYIYDLQIISYIAASGFLIITIFLYFFEILNSEKVLNIKKNLLFWISIGLVLYHIGNIPFRVLRNYYSDLTDATVSFLLGVFLVITMNICFIIGFIWSDRKQLY
jgi:hypothetical protein